MTREQQIDSAVQRRLATDRAYRNAESAEVQAEREAEIVAEVERASAPGPVKVADRGTGLTTEEGRQLQSELRVSRLRERSSSGG